MMMSPEAYKDGLAGLSACDLIARRDELIGSARAFEEGRLEDDDICRDPDPDAVYQIELLYLAKVCEALSEEHGRIAWDEGGLG